MDRNREARRANIAATNGLSRRRHRSSSLRDSPEEDGLVELPEPARLRERGVRKDRDRDRDRDRLLSRSKRRRGDRLMHGSNREDGGEDSTEESVNDEDELEDDELSALPPNPAALMTSSSTLNHHNRKSFPPVAKLPRPASAWKAADEMIGVSVPRKARSASTKRSHECWVSASGVGGDQIYRQTSTSPLRPSLASTSTAYPAPASPSSSNASARKKMKPNGSKPRPPKSTSKSSSSNPEELEIEIAEVLYGLMTQSQGPSKKETNNSGKFDSRETNKSSSDAKSRVSSPISNSPSTAPQSSAMLPQNSSSPAAPLSAVAPKRKRPRQVSDNLGGLGVRNNPITTKVEMDQPPKAEISSPNLEKTTGSAAENGGVPYDLSKSEAVTPSSEPPPELAKPESSTFSQSKPLMEAGGETRRDVVATKEEVTSPKNESPAVRVEDHGEDVTATKASTATCEIESHREEKFQIDLMAPPPQLRSSPEREGEMDLKEADHKGMVSHVDAEMRPITEVKDYGNAVKNGKDGLANVEPEEKKSKTMVEEGESQKPVANRERKIDLQFDLEKPDRDSEGLGSASGNNVHPHFPKQQQQHQPLKSAKEEEPHTEKTAQSRSLPLPMSMASWPGGLPPMGYMAPLQGVVSMDGGTVTSTPLQLKRCATHCYIARNIYNLQQLMKMNPFWPAAAAAGSASLFGAKPSNLNVVTPAELHGNVAGRSVNSLQDKGQGLGIFPGHSGKDKGSQVANIADAAQRKQQILLHQALPPGVPPNNILHGPTFIFPLSQQQAATAAVSARPGSMKSPTTTGSVSSSNASSSASVSASATAATTAAAVSFNYPNMTANDTQYLAILQNNGYHPFPIPAVAAPPTYRGSHAQAMPYFNGSFYSSQMIHPSQLQHQHQHQQQPPTQPQLMQQGHQNNSISSASSSQKHLQSQQQRPQSSSTNGGSGSGNLNSFPAPKSRPSQQHQPNQQITHSHQARQLETEVGGEDSPSTADSRVSRPTMNVYGSNFAMPIHPQNFALLTPPSVLAGTSVSGGGNQNEKKQQQQSQQQGLKAGVESLPPQTFAMSFASINGANTAPGIDISSIAQNHPIFQSFPEATRHHTYQIMAAVAQQKNFQVSEEGKTGGGESSNNGDDEKKSLAGKAPATLGQSIAFSRSDLTDVSVSSISGNTVIDSSARTTHLPSTRASRSPLPSAMGTGSAPNSHHLQVQLQHQQQQLHQQQLLLQKQQQQQQQQQQLHQHQQQQQQQQQQLQQQQQQQQHFAAAARSKTTATSNGSVYSDRITSSSSITAKFPNMLPAFSQTIVQSSGSSPAQSPQWKNSVKTTTSQVPSSLASSTPSSLKNISQQQARTQQSHTQISFGTNPKSSAASQGQQALNSNQSPSPPVVGSPTTSSISKGASGSPRTTTSSSTGIKAAQPSTLSSQQTKNSPTGACQKSSPVGGKNVPSILGNPHITSSSSTGTKPQMLQQQQQQQQLPKTTLQQQQLFFPGAYMQAQRRRPDQPQQAQGSSATSSTGMLSLCPPVTLTTSDPAKAVVAAAANNMKGGGLPSQGILHPAQFAGQSSGNPHQLVPAAFSYHTVAGAVQVKAAEQKQPAGNDNLHTCWQPEKK